MSHLPVGNAQTSPTISNATVQNQQTTLTVPSGAQLYVYGFATGGAFSTSAFANGQYASVTDADGYTVAALAITTSNANSYTTQTAYYAIGGVSASDYSSYTASYGSNPAPGASSASDTFSVVTAGSLVVVVAIGGDEQSISVSGVPGLTSDATNFNGACNQGLPPIIVIGHAYPNPGTYTVTEQTTQCAAGQDPNHAGDLIGVFVFSSQQSPTTSQLTPTTTTVSCSPTTVIAQSPTTCTATVTGSSPSGTVTFSSSSSTGSFTPPNAQCTLLSATCSVSYSDTSTGTPTITGSYGGDMNNDASSGVATISVTSSSTTSGSFDFGLDNSGPITLSPGASGSDIITAILVTGSASPVSLSCNTLGAPLPAGVSCSFNPPSVTPTAAGATSSLVVSTAASTPPGSYAVTVFGTAGEVTRNTDFTLTVSSFTSSSFDFHLGCAGINSCEIVVTPGSSGKNIITATIVSGTAQPVSLSCTSGLPTGASCSFNPESGTPTFTAVLTIGTAPSTLTGAYPITVTATGGDATRTTSFTLLVNAGTSQSSCGSPTITLSAPQINGLSVTVNGATLPGSSSCSITSVSWSWGDGSLSNSWFPATHTYVTSNTYSITATTHQSDGQTATASTSITIGQSTPTSQLTTIQISVSPSIVTQITGLSGSTIALKAFDQKGNPMANVPIFLTATSPGVLSPVSITTDGNGQATSMLILAESVYSSVVVSVRADSGNVLSESIEVAFVSSATGLLPQPETFMVTHESGNAWTYVNTNISGLMALDVTASDQPGTSVVGSFGYAPTSCNSWFNIGAGQNIAACFDLFIKGVSGAASGIVKITARMTAPTQSACPKGAGLIVSPTSSVGQFLKFQGVLEENTIYPQEVICNFLWTIVQPGPMDEGTPVVMTFNSTSDPPVSEVPGTLLSTSETGNSWTYVNNNICGTSLQCISKSITIASQWSSWC